MPQFRCRVGTPQGSFAERLVQAASPIAAREQLVADGLEVFDIAERSPSTLFPTLHKLANMRIGGSRESRSWFGGKSKLPTADLLLLNQELAALVNAGLPLLRCIDILRTRRAGSLAGSMLDRVRQQVAAGDSLSAAFRPEIERVGAPDLFVTSLEVGEASGDLVMALQRYCSHLERSVALRRKVQSALMYPAVLALVSFVVVLILLIVVIPQFAGFYDASGAELPLTTRALVGLAGLVSVHGLWIGVVVAAAVVWYRRWSRTPKGRETVDGLKLRVPVVGSLRLRYFGLETARTLATLLRGGAPLVRALQVTAQGTENRVARGRLLACAEQISHGSSLHEALDDQRVLDSLGLELVQVGESAGALEEMLEHVAATYDEVLDRQVTWAVGLMQPAMLVVMGVIVAAIVLSLYLPLFQTVQVVG